MRRVSSFAALGLLVALTSAVLVEARALAAESDLWVHGLPIGKGAGPQRRVATLSYEVYAQDVPGTWTLRDKRANVALGDCAECTRGVALECGERASAATCSALGTGLGVRIEGDSFDQLHLAINNGSRFLLVRSMANATWPVELALHDGQEDEPGAPRYKMVLNVFAFGSRPAKHRR